MKQFLIGVVLMYAMGCSLREQTPLGRTVQEIVESGELRVTTLPNSAGCFTLKNELVGYDYELVLAYAEALGVELKLELATSLSEMERWLRRGRVDMVIYPTVHTQDLKKERLIIPIHDTVPMVLVQRKGRKALNNVTQLAGCRVVLTRHSAYYKRAQQLNKEIGGDITISFANDSLQTDELMLQVAQGAIDYTIAFRSDADDLQRIYPHLDTRLTVSVPLPYGWQVSRTSTDLANHVHVWYKGLNLRYLNRLKRNDVLVKKYQMGTSATLSGNGVISPYDTFFKRYAPICDWDWRLLAALCYHESRFNPEIVSPVGAMGLMQLMPQTGERFGITEENAFLPEENIKAGAEYIRYLTTLFSQITDPEERIKFILASYNSGPGHVQDAMRLAEKYGRNPYVWYNHVAYYMQAKRDPNFYTDEVVKNGRFNASYTLKYVVDVQDTYVSYLQRKLKK